ncbi:MAG TPA: DUF2079 domain-containing protein [Chloroflexota bacterium]|nr:DUF2079 domain-containing protein [Chloroflexota bacterium]
MALGRRPAPLIDIEPPEVTMSIAPPVAPARRIEPALLVTLLLAVAYTVLFGTISIERYLNFHYGGDTADYAQMLWNTVHGRLLQKTSIYTAGAGLRGGHVEPILLLLAIPYAVFPDPRTMLALQTLALASGGPLTYYLARLHGHGQRVALGLATLYLVFPLVHYANIWDFHPDPFAVPALFGALIAFDTRRWRLLALCLVVILLTKEQMVLFVFGLGAYWWLARGARRVGLLAIGAALLYGLAVLLPWMLLTASQFSHDYSSYFSDVQQATAGHASGGLGVRIQAVVNVLAQEWRFQNLFLALLPTGLLFLLDASALITFLPLAGLFVSNQFTNDFWFHHYVTCVPIFLYGISRVLTRPHWRQRSGFLATLLIVWACLLGYIYSDAPLNMMYWLHDPSVYMADDHSRAQAAFIHAIPAGVGLDSDSSLASHLTDRVYLYQIQNPDQPLLVPYTLLDLHQDMRNPPSWLVENNRNTLAFIRKTGGFRIARADRRHGLYLFANCARFPMAMSCPRR